MKSKLVMGNWKMGDPILSKEEYLRIIAEASDGFKGKVILFPHFLAIQELAKLSTTYPNIAVGAQNVNYNKGTAYTGEISAEILQEYGAEYVLIGHSERREYFSERNEELQKKIQIALQHGLNPVGCVGENRRHRKNKIVDDLVSLQTHYLVNSYSEEQAQRIIIAYEPVWAIGTNKIPQFSEINRMVELIRNVIQQHFNTETANNAYILYGGSVNSENIDSLFENTQCNGVLVGGASLKADDFAQIIASAKNF